MNKEKIKERIAKLTSERDQLARNLDAYVGAIQEATYWLENSEEVEKTSGGS